MEQTDPRLGCSFWAWPPSLTDRATGPSTRLLYSITCARPAMDGLFGPINECGFFKFDPFIVRFYKFLFLYFSPKAQKFYIRRRDAHRVTSETSSEIRWIKENIVFRRQTWRPTAAECPEIFIRCLFNIKKSGQQRYQRVSPWLANRQRCIFLNNMHSLGKMHHA